MGLNRIHRKYLLLFVAFAVPFGNTKADLLVTDQTNHSVLRFSNAGVSLGTFIPSGSGGQLDGIPVFGRLARAILSSAPTGTSTSRTILRMSSGVSTERRGLRWGCLPQVITL